MDSSKEGRWIQITDGDLTPLILSRLPAKSVLRFRSVCRRWLELISEATFLRSHTLSNPRPPAAGLFLRSRRPNYLRLHPLPGISSLPGPSLSFMDSIFDSAATGAYPLDSISGLCSFMDSISDSAATGACPLGSSNGLVLCRGPINSVGPTPHYVCNPTTKECRRIPDPPLDIIEVFALFFDPSSPVCRHPSLHYKIVCLGLSLYDEWYYQIKIFSSLTWSWCFSGKPFPLGDLSIIRLTHSASSGGAVHWPGNLNRLVSYQMDNEQLRVTPFPAVPEEHTPRKREYLGTSGDRLHLIETYSNCFSLLHIFELNHDYSGWMLLYRIDKIEILTGPEPVYVLGQVEEAEEEDGDGGGRWDSLLLIHETHDHRRKIVSYHLQKSCYDRVNYVPDNFIPCRDNYYRTQVVLFAHSLFSP